MKYAIVNFGYNAMFCVAAKDLSKFLEVTSYPRVNDTWLNNKLVYFMAKCNAPEIRLVDELPISNEEMLDLVAAAEKAEKAAEEEEEEEEEKI